MDDINLNSVLQNIGSRQFWLKPVGDPDTSPDERRLYISDNIRIDFATKPAAIKLEDVLIVYRIKLGKLLFIAEVQSSYYEITDDELQKDL